MDTGKKMYRITLCFAMIVSVVCVIGNVVSGFPFAASIKWIVLFGVSLLAGLATRHERTYPVGRFCFFLFLIAGFLPVAFIDSGGSNNNALGYTFLLAIAVTYLFTGRQRVVLIVLLISVFAMLLLLEYFSPQWITQYPPSSQLIDRLIQVPMQIIAAFLIVRMYAGAYDQANRQLATERWNLEHSMEKLSLSEKQLQEANRALEELRITDKLTQIFNRSKIDEVLDLEMARFRRSGAVFCIAMIDIDHFKAVNDTYGHQAGDVVLAEFARRLKAGIRKTDFVGRWGGEEFLILFPDTELVNAYRKTQQLLEDLGKSPFPAAGRMTFSAGVACADSGATAGEMIRQADQALYSAKKGGRSQVICNQAEAHL